MLGALLAPTVLIAVSNCTGAAEVAAPTVHVTMESPTSVEARGTASIPSTSTPTPTLIPPAPESVHEWWSPAQDASWQWQLQGAPNISHDAEVYDIDLFDTPSETIAELHGLGRHVVCYFSVGSFEEWREDADAFDPVDLGEALEGWEGERWLDIRSPRVRNIMLARLDLAAARGCDAVEPDNAQAYLEDSGFDLTARDQLDYNRLLAEAAHERGLGIGLKNDGPQASLLAEHFDFAVTEECQAFEECAYYTAFIRRGRPVFNAEYFDSLAEAEDAANVVCAEATVLGIQTLLLPLALDDTFRISCAERAH